MTEEFIVPGYSLPINLEYKDAIKVDWLANPNATRIASAALEFHPYLVFEYILEITRNDPIGGMHRVKDNGIHFIDASNGRFLFPPRRFDSATPFRALDRITSTKGTENLDLITNAEITETIIDLKTAEAVPNNKIVLNGDYEVGIIGDEISIKTAERKVLKKVVSENTQKASYYTSNRKGKRKERKIEITPRFSEVISNRKAMIYVPRWIIGIKAGERIYNRIVLAASKDNRKVIVDEIAFCPHHSLARIWNKHRWTSAVCEICGGAFCDDHIFKVNDIYYCEKHQPSNTN